MNQKDIIYNIEKLQILAYFSHKFASYEEIFLLDIYYLLYFSFVISTLLQTIDIVKENNFFVIFYFFYILSFSFSFKLETKPSKHIEGSSPTTLSRTGNCPRS
jgi:hypothetical protein